MSNSIAKFQEIILFFLILILFYGAVFSAYPADLEMRRVSSTLPISQTLVIHLRDEEFKQFFFGLLNFIVFMPEETPYLSEKAISVTRFNPDRRRIRIYSSAKRDLKLAFPAADFRHPPLLQCIGSG